MKPLRDRNEPMSPIEASAVSLLRSLEPYRPPPEFKRQVRARLLTLRTATHAHLIRPATVVGALLLAAGASAAITGTWVLHEYRGHQPSPVAAVPQQRPPLSPVTPSLVANEPTSEPAPEDQGAPVVPHAQSTTRSGAQGPAQGPTKAADQSKLVFDSMRALRRDGHPERAARLLDEYLRRYPNGALAEEALALSIEATSMLGDPRAKDLAQRYLVHYPSGQFRKAAERARARFAP